MKRFAIFILCNLLTFFTYAGVMPYPGLRERIARDPEGSLLLLDSLEEKGTIPQCTAPQKLDTKLLGCFL